MVLTRYSILKVDRRSKNMLLKRKTLFLTGIAGVSLLYFTAFSSLSIPFWLRGNVAIIPLQVLAILYLLYWNRKQ